MNTIIKISSIALALTSCFATANTANVTTNNHPAININTIQFKNHTNSKFACFTGKPQLQLVSSHKLILPGASSLSAPHALQVKVTVNDSWTCQPIGRTSTKLYSLIGTIDAKDKNQLNIDIKPIKQPLA